MSRKDSVRFALIAGFALSCAVPTITQAAAPPAGTSTAAELPRLLPPVRSSPPTITAVQDLLEDVAARHPELFTGPDQPGIAIISQVLRADGSVERSELTRVAPAGASGLAETVPPGVRVVGSSIRGLSQGITTRQGARLNTQVVLSQNRATPQTAGAADASRSPQRVNDAALASLSSLLLPVSGDTFNRVTVFMSEDGRIERHYVELRRRDELRPYGDITPLTFAKLWEPLGLQAESLGTMGITNVYQGNSTWMIVRYAWPRRPGEAIGGTPQSPATAALANSARFSHADAARVVDHHLPGALNDQGVSPQGTPWLVLSRDGRVLRSGYTQLPQGQMLSAMALQPQVPDLRLGAFLPMQVVKEYAVAYNRQVWLAWVQGD